MTRRQVLAGFLFLSLIPAAALAAEVPTHLQEIDSLKLQFAAASNPEQRKQFVAELKTLAKSSSAGDAGALNAAVSAMLPAADSAGEAEELLEIGAANPAGQLASAPSLPEDAEFLVDARRAAAEEARNLTGDPSGDVETLADIRIDHLQKDSLGRDGLASAHVQKVWRINTMQGAKSFSTRSVMYSGMSETLSMVRARVLKSDGREAEATVSADQPVVERGSSMYFDSRSRDLRFPHLQPGDLVEIEYRLLPAAEVNPWAGYYARIDSFRDALATRLRRRVLIAPSSMKLYAVEHGLGPAVVRQQGAETTRIWEARGIDAAAPSPGASASEAYLHVSTIGSMEEFGRWYSELLEPGLKLDENLRTVAQQILERNLTTQDKVQAVYTSVQRTKYTAFEFGVHSYQPYPVSTVESRGFGDCKDKAALLVALLRAVGVPAEFAMVRTRSAGTVAEDAYSVQMFDHALAYVPELNLYLDGTAQDAAPGQLPPHDLGAMAMTVDAQGKATRRTVPFTSAQASREIREEQAHLAGDGRTTLAQLVPAAKIAPAAVTGGAGASPEGEMKVGRLIAAARSDH